MAYKIFDDYSKDYTNSDSDSNGTPITLHINTEQRADLPDSSYVRDADMSRDGADLVLETNHGTVIIEGYFTSDPMPHLVAPDGMTLTPNLVQSFIQGGNQYADAGTAINDASPVGTIQEISGEATVTRLNGTIEVAGIGTPIYPGDVVETDETGAVNIMFIDETTFAVSEDARLAIDEYIFDPATQSGTSNFSVLKGVFVFTSGLIGRDDPDDVMIKTPSGSIGIRGTIIAGDVDTGEITVIEGAIVLHDFHGNSVTLANQYETARFNLIESKIDHMGELGADEVGSKFMSVSTVAADLFSSIADSAVETRQDNKNTPQNTRENENTEPQESQGEDAQNDGADASGEGDPSQDVKMTDVITSGDIIGANNTDAKPVATQQTNTKPATAPDQTTNFDTKPPTAPPTDNTDKPPFQIEVTKFNVLEGSTGSTVAQVKGDFTNLTNISLIGPSNNYYEILRIDNNTLNIKLKIGTSIDAEQPHKLNISASNQNGASHLFRDINLSVTNIDEATTYSASTPNSFFKGSANSVFTYDFSQDFNDPEGDIFGYTLTTPPSNADISAYNLDYNTGIMTITFDSAVTTDSFNFTVEAQSTSGNIDNTYAFDLVQSTTGSAFITTASSVYSGTDASITSIADSASIYTDSNNADNVINIQSTNNHVKAGGGNDSINIATGSTGFDAYGDNGNDIFELNEVQGNAYGMAGNDKFLINSTGAASDLESLTTGVKIDGGTGHDLLQFTPTASGNIDFSAITTGFIKNIEKIAFINSNTDAITLDYNSVINMTDENNVLKIDLDANDTLTFNNTSPNDFFLVKEDFSDGGNTYDMYTDGTVTLLVDTDSSNVSGII